MVHCDLKPQNILIDGYWNAKIADFGSAHIYFMEGEDQMLSHRGTFEFFAPECFKQQGKGTTYYSGRKADVWALGLCIYALAFNDLPFVMGQGAETRYAHADMEDLD